MDTLLQKIKTQIYDQCSWDLSEFKAHAESKEYDACQFKLNGQCIISRSAKITPRKAGQFVTCWRRAGSGPIMPFSEHDQIDFLVVNIRTEDKMGQFVFPKSVLIKKGILSTATKDGKRAFRVYPKWDIGTSKQAAQTQAWQLDYFYEISPTVDVERVSALYANQ